MENLEMGVSTGNLLSEMMNFFVWLLSNLHVLVVNKYIFFIKTFHFEPKNCVGRKQSAGLF